LIFVRPLLVFSLCVALTSDLAAQSRAREPQLTSARQSTDSQITADSKLLALQPANNRIAARLALDYIQKMRETVNFDYLNLASRLVDGILDRDPGNYEALRLRSEIEMERHHFALVAEYSMEMTRFYPNDPGAWGSLGDASMELGEYARAGDAYKKMVSLRPGLTSYNRLAWYRFVTGDAVGSVALMQSAISAGNAAPENVAWCWAEIGRMYWKIGRADEALNAYRSALAAFPNYYAAWAGIGWIESAHGQVKDAIDAYRQAQATVPMPEYAEALEDLYERSGDHAAARRQHELIDAIEITMRASGEKTNRNMALLYANQNRNLDRAAELVENEIKVRPDVYTHDALAWVLYRQGKLEEAGKASEVALSRGTPEPMFYFHSAMIDQALGKRDQAAQKFSHALALNPEWDFHQSAVARQAEEILQSSRSLSSQSHVNKLESHLKGPTE
jgi:tetratricopeptide (TPR) repeat protein